MMKARFCWQKLYLSLLSTVVVGEALGLFHALRWLSDMQFDNVGLALDSKIATNTFNHHWVDVTELIMWFEFA